MNLHSLKRKQNAQAQEVDVGEVRKSDQVYSNNGANVHPLELIVSYGYYFSVPKD